MLSLVSAWWQQPMSLGRHRGSSSQGILLGEAFVFIPVPRQHFALSTYGDRNQVSLYFAPGKYTTTRFQRGRSSGTSHHNCVGLGYFVMTVLLNSSGTVQAKWGRSLAQSTWCNYQRQFHCPLTSVSWNKTRAELNSKLVVSLHVVYIQPKKKTHPETTPGLCHVFSVEVSSLLCEAILLQGCTI